MRRVRIILPRATATPWYARWQQRGTIERWRMLTQLVRDEQKCRSAGFRESAHYAPMSYRRNVATVLPSWLR